MSEKIKALKAERDQLIAANAQAASWGAALGARQERINEIERELLREDRAARIPERDDEVMLSEDGMKAEIVDFPPGTVICVGPSGRLRVETGEVVGCSIILSSSSIPAQDDEALMEIVSCTGGVRRATACAILAALREARALK